jgi:hypothetical protein
MTETNRDMELNKEILEDKVAEIRSNRDLNDEAKKRMIGEAYDEAVAEHRKLVQEEDDALSQTLESAARSALTPPYIPGTDKVMVGMSYRDALNRLADVREPAELLRVLDRAQKTGDEILAKAVLYRGYELQSQGVVGAYTRAYPGEAHKWSSYMDAAEAFNEHRKRRQLFGMIEPRKPKELGS